MEKTVKVFAESSELIREINHHRDNSRPPAVAVQYYFEALHRGGPGEALKEIAKMTLEHGTLKPWEKEGDARIPKPAGYDENMSWAKEIQLLGYNKEAGLESGLVTIAYPLCFFDKTPDGSFPFAQMMMAVASEPVSAFTNYRAAKIVDVRLPDELKKRTPGCLWPHGRVREYLGLAASEPIIGTIVKPKTGLTPDLFARCVVEAACAGARFTKADENHHLTLKEVPAFVEKTVRELEKAGFDLSRENNAPKGTRFLFAPHITADEENMADYAKAAVEAGANALMFSPYYAGGFKKLAEICRTFDVPVYAHTAGMNMLTGSPGWGIDPRVMYYFAAAFGAAFMQLPAMRGYIRPFDEEKPAILSRLEEDAATSGLTLVIAGGLGAGNIGANMQELGVQGRMFLAGTSVYSHPDGVTAGVKAIILAYRAYREKNIVSIRELIAFGRDLGTEGEPLINALKNC